jgi:hypothetical protein
MAQDDRLDIRVEILRLLLQIKTGSRHRRRTAAPGSPGRGRSGPLITLSRSRVDPYVERLTHTRPGSRSCTDDGGGMRRSAWAAPGSGDWGLAAWGALHAGAGPPVPADRVSQSVPGAQP